MKIPASRLALPITLLVLAIYLVLLPWTEQVWTRTGDEPHYLIAADALVRAGTFDLRHSYDPSVYLDWYPSPRLDRQVKTRADGAQFLIHPYGLSLLIAPAYALAGARGVAYFMILLGALLAGQVYLLALQVTGHWRASALAALVVALAPPVVWYVYLLYPEIAGALCVTVAARILLALPGRSLSPKGTAAPFSPFPFREGGPGGLGLLLLGLSLAALPWLSARFIPAAVALAALAVLRQAFSSSIAHYQLPITRPQFGTTHYQLRITNYLFAALSAWPALLLFGLSLAGLAWFNAVHYGSSGLTASYTGDVNPGPVSLAMLWQFTRGLFGWLIDHQRGLLVAGPIYFVAFIGLGQWLWRRAWGALVVGLPFAAALASTALIGGFWVGIEPAARYLIYVLPLFGAALAYAWVHCRGPWLASLTALTLAASLWTAAQVFQQPRLAQTHDLIGERLPALVSYLPALGKPTYLDPGAPGDLAAPVAALGQAGLPALWRAPKGQAGSALQHPTIVDLPFGWYTLQFNLGAQGASADTPVARVLFQSGDHAPLVDTMLYGRDFSPDGQLRTMTFPVFNGIYNQWEQPAGFWIFTTGQAELTLSGITFEPETFHSLILPGLWLAGLALVGVLVGSRFQAEALAPAVPGGLFGWAPLAVGVVLVLGLGAWSLRPVPRQYPISELSNFIGSRVPEAAALDGLAVSTLGDEDTPGVLAATAPELWPAGRYAWRLSLKVPGPVAVGSTLATVRIRSPRQSVPGFPAQVAAAAVPADGRFHSLEVQFDNPVHQALVFELDASGAAPLESQGFEVSPLP